MDCLYEETKLKRRKKSRGTRLDAAKYRGRAKAHVPIRDITLPFQESLSSGFVVVVVVVRLFTFFPWSNLFL